MALGNFESRLRQVFETPSVFAGREELLRCLLFGGGRLGSFMVRAI